MITGFFKNSGFGIVYVKQSKKYKKIEFYLDESNKVKVGKT